MNRLGSIASFLVLLSLSQPVATAQLCLPPSECPSCNLWESYWVGNPPGIELPAPDPDQSTTDNRLWMTFGAAIGQTFVATDSDLYRIDVRMQNRSDLRPFTVRLFEWAGSPSASAQGAVLWRDTRSLPGSDASTILSFFPRLTVTAGNTYFIELGPVRDSSGVPQYETGEWGVANEYFTDPADDPYPGGSAWRGDWNFNGTRDLWFRVYASPTGNEIEPCECYSASGTWTDPDPPGAMITAQDFRNIVYDRVVNNTSCDAAQAVPTSVSHECASYHAFLYEAESYPGADQDAVTLLALAADFRDEILTDPDPNNDGLSWNYLEHAGWAYRWLQGSPALTAVDEDKIKSLLLHTADWFRRNRPEFGTNNRSLGRTLMLKMVTNLVPASDFARLTDPSQGAIYGYWFPEVLDAADHAEWVTSAHDSYNEFKIEQELQEDSTHYNSLSWRYFLQLVMEMGADDSIWNEPFFRELIERAYNNHTPLGPRTIAGDGRGLNQDWGATTWLFAKAANKWNDPRYDATAFRTFDFQRGRLKDYPLWRAVYNEGIAFALAYFDITQISNVQPPEQSEQVEAAQDQQDANEWKAGSGGVGQTFHNPAATTLVRLDVKARNSGDPNPGTIMLWEWTGSYGGTVGNPPLYHDTVDLADASGMTVVSFFPFLEVEAGKDYYFEISRPTELRLAGSGPSPNPDYYPDGHLWQNGKSKSPRDLWFKAYSLTDNGSTYTTRRKQRLIRLSEREDPPRHYEFVGTDRVPDKLVLRSGHDPDDFHAIVNLVAGSYGHGQLETAGILSMSDDNSLLLADTEYYDRQPQFHTLPVTFRHWSDDPGSDGYIGDSDNGPDPAMEVTHFADYREATVAWTEWNDIHGFDARHERRFYFAKDRFLWIRDRTTFGAAMSAATGNLWRSYDLHHSSTGSIHDFYNREPLGIATYGPLGQWKFKNPEHSALLYMIDRGYDYRTCKDPSGDNPPSPPFIVSQQWQGDAMPGTTVWFDSVVLPHGPDVTRWEAAANITELYDDGVNVAVKIKIGLETWFAVDNPDGIGINTSELRTDARYLLARTQFNREHYVMTQDATQAWVDGGVAGVLDLTWSQPTSVEIGGYTSPPPAAPACPAAPGCSGGGACLPSSSPFSVVDHGYNFCETEDFEIFDCGNQTVHVASYDCHQAPCCYDDPGCVCPLECATGSYLECR